MSEKSSSAGYVYDKEYFRVQKSSWSGVHGRGSSWVARVKAKGKKPRQLYFADEEDAAAAVDCFARENGEDAPNFGDFEPRRVLSLEEVEQKRIRHGDRFKEKPKAALAYTFTPTSPYKGVNYHHGRWIARYSEAGQSLNLGSFTTQKEAAEAWDVHALACGRTALNFEHPAAPGGGSPSKLLPSKPTNSTATNSTAKSSVPSANDKSPLAKERVTPKHTALARSGGAAESIAPNPVQVGSMTERQQLQLALQQSKSGAQSSRRRSS